ncbi:MAG: phospholipase A [Gammaproteobacteria bacterium]|nr:phospholipase A [Gammaproteobacteria bacterium]
MISIARLRIPLAMAVLGMAASLATQVALAETGSEQTSMMEKCLLDNMQTAKPDTTVAKLRQNCEQSVAKTGAKDDQTLQEEPLTPVQQRMFDDQINYDRQYIISTFRPNYFMATYNDDPNNEPFYPITDGEDVLNRGEAKFQVSFKAPLWRNIGGTNNDLLGAYTSTSWWQIGNDDDEASSAFRETNYEPEIFLRHYAENMEIFGGKVRAFDLGVNHQSNGRSQLLSRSWNRVMGRAYIDWGDVAVALRAWYRIPEDDDDDDNKYMYRYYGAGDVTVVWAPNKNTFSAMIRPGTEENGLEFTWSYPVTKILRVYAQYWNGYGESLLDYNVRTERIGIGIALNDWIDRR